MTEFASVVMEVLRLTEKEGFEPSFPTNPGRKRFAFHPRFRDHWNQGHEIIAWLRQVAEKREDLDDARRYTFLYFVQDAGGPVKIGIAANPWNRFKNLQVANPRRLTLLAVVPATADLERLLHSILRPDRIRGEWFASTPRVLAVVEEFIGVATMCEDAVTDPQNAWEPDHVDVRAWLADGPLPPAKAVA
jgi:hypothetical protein